MNQSGRQAGKCRQGHWKYNSTFLYREWCKGIGSDSKVVVFKIKLIGVINKDEDEMKKQVYIGSGVLGDDNAASD